MPRLAEILILAPAAAALSALPGVGCGGLAAGDRGDATVDVAIEAGSDAIACGDATTSLSAGRSSQLIWPWSPSLLLDATDVYWVASLGMNTNPKNVLRTPKAGGATTMLATPCDGNLALDDTQIYFTASDSDAGPATLYALKKTGGTRSVLAEGLPSIRTLVVDDVAVYFAAGGKVSSVPKAGRALTTLSAATTIPCLGTGACWPPAVFGIDDQNVYWSVEGGNTYLHPVTEVRATSKASGTVTTLITLPTSTLTAIAGANDIFFTSQNANTGTWSVASVPKRGGSPKTLATGVGGSDLATDGRGLFTEGTGPGNWPAIVEVPLAGGPTTATFLRTGFGFAGIAVDESFIYWFDWRELGAGLVRSCK